MDIHNVPGIEALDLAEAHRKDILIQDSYRCKCMTYWIDEARGVAFCLIEAPDKSVVEEMHKNAHGFIPNKIIEVKNEVVESFLGRIHDPEEAEISNSGLKVFRDIAFRIILVADSEDPVLLRHNLGVRNAGDLLKKLNTILRKELLFHAGREVEHTGSEFIASFSSAGKAVSCALAIQKNLSGPDLKLTGFKIGITAGNPVAKSERLFGDSIQLARYLYTVSHNKERIVVSSVVNELLTAEQFAGDRKHFITILPQDEILLQALFRRLQENWQDPDFTVSAFCRSMSMSKSQFYRKTVAFWNLSPNLLLKEFRLNKARELLKGRFNNISQTTFDSGFTSPSYFTKCFKKKFGLLPAAYLHSLK
jgi:AraC-like DNA-binding protein